MNQQRLSSLLDRLTISLRARERRAAADVGLQPVHLQILGYLAKCNRFSNTPIAVSEYLGIQKGTISQSVALLVEKGYVVKQNDPLDRRLVRLVLTEEGRQLAGSGQSLGAAQDAVTGLEPTKAYALEQQLHALVSRLNSGPGTRSFETCQSCKHVRRDPHGYNCALMGVVLSHSALTEICRDHAPRTHEATMARSTAQ